MVGVTGYIRRIIIIFSAIAAIGMIASIPTGHTSGDFDVYYQAGQNYLAGAPLYNPHKGIEEFKYLPIFALAFSPLALMGKTQALYLWGILNIFLLYFMFYFLYKLKQISFNRLQDFFIIFCLFAVTGRYIFADIKVGQVNIVICFLLVLAMYFEINKRYFWAALPLALSLTIKLFPLLFLVYFVLRRRFRAAGYTILMTGIFLLLPGIYSGFGLNFRYLQEWLGLLESTPATMLYSVKNYSLLAFFSWFFVSSHLSHFVFGYFSLTAGLTPEVYYAWAASCLFLFSLFFRGSFFKKDIDRDTACLDYACLFICALLFNPLTHLNTLVLLIIPYLFILRPLFYPGLARKWRVTIGALVVLSFITTMAYNKVFFSDIKQFYASLVYRFPLWTILLVYFSLWLLKLQCKKLKECKIPDA